MVSGVGDCDDVIEVEALALLEVTRGGHEGQECEAWAVWSIRREVLIGRHEERRVFRQRC